ncbi:hypothetical protein L915_05824 [Phytophthora nicotianae]|uniref:Uncharacterized protein n=1 Tax=Phytophthora nicotianae TaxID=4792 RepID=W2NQ99_PHYNI|nr:hypothetical protein L915_05824 [Phytophthora nicotianae]ETL43828.1 hypothetical protein L916_05755 [Phytophthora nicotianae]ETM50143.1 hypothetical protein L914_05770 [Phytophthora nicotianae]
MSRRNTSEFCVCLVPPPTTHAKPAKAQRKFGRSFDLKALTLP